MLARLTAFIIRIKWLVVVLWIAAAAILALAAPRLSDILSTDSGSFLPADSRTAQADKLIKSVFPESAGHTALVLVISSDTPLTGEDEAYIRALDEHFTQNKASLSIGEVMSPFTSDAMKTQLTSEDGKVALVYLNLDVAPYTDRCTATLEQVHATVDAGRIDVDGTSQEKPAGLNLYVTGDAAIGSEQHQATNRSMDIVTKITIALLLVILVIIYRSPVAPLLPLLTIGLSFLASRGIIGFLTLGGFKISSFTETFLIAVLFGAGTDYCMLILSRFKEELSHGKKRDQALIDAMPSTGIAILSSGGTVVVGFLFMIFAQFGLFSTTGPSVAIGVVITILAVLTLIPAFIAILGERIYWPTRSFSAHNETLRTGIWAKLAGKVTTMPVRFLLVSLLAFVPFIWSATGMNISYDNMKDLPEESSSIKGFSVMSEHFRKGDLLPVRVTLKTDNDFWNTEHLRTLDMVAENLLKLDHVDVVRSATRPLGEKLTQASLGSQIDLLSGGMGDIQEGFAPLIDGMNQIRDGIDKVGEGLAGGGGSIGTELGGSVGTMQTGLSATQAGLGKLGDGTDKANGGIAEIARQLGTLSTGTSQTTAGLRQIGASIDGALASLGKLAAADPTLQLNMDYQTAYGTLKAVSEKLGGVETGLDRISGGIAQAAGGLTQIGGGLTGVSGGIRDTSEAISQINQGLSDMKAGAEKAGTDLGSAADALAKLSDGIPPITDGLRKMEDGTIQLRDKTADYGGALQEDFYLPADVFTQYPEFRDALLNFTSEDGKGTTFDIVLSATPYSTTALDTITAIEDTVAFSLKNTPLEGTAFALSGVTATFSEVRDMIGSDLVIVILFVLSGIFLILALLLHSLVAPFYLLLTTVLSYVSTLGISYLVFHGLLGQDGLHWSVPFFSFCVLVALGVDYNIFLITRVKEEYIPGDMKKSVTTALATTGGIITSCGVIMAGTFGSMMFSPMRPMVQVGFAACVGIILDTFIIRSVVVPAIAVLVGELSWWPGRKMHVTSVDRKSGK